MTVQRDITAQYETGYVRFGSRNRPQDWMNLVLGIWLFVSPWVLGYAGGTTTNGAASIMAGNAAWNAWILGVLVVLNSAWSLSQLEPWKEGINQIMGAWIFAAPWALNFTRLSAAAWDQWLTGAAIFLVALSCLASRPVAGPAAGPIVTPPSNEQL